MDVRVIGERINAAYSSARQALENRNSQALTALAREQMNAGAALLDIHAGGGPEEAERLGWAAGTVCAACGPVAALDSASPDVLEAALAACGGAVINSASARADSLRRLLPLARQYKVPMICLAMDESGLPDTAEARLLAAEKALRFAQTQGLPDHQLWIDCLAMPELSRPDQRAEALRAVTLVREKLGLHTVLGISNVSYRAPDRPAMNRSFLRDALNAGVTRPILNPCQAGMAPLLASIAYGKQNRS